MELQVIQLNSYNNILTKVQFIARELKLNLKKKTGRPLSISGEETIAIALFKQKTGMPTKRQTYDTLLPKCSYKTLVVNMNNLSGTALFLLLLILKKNRIKSHIVKHTDSTDIPVCLNKNAKYNKTMKELANWGHSGKGFYYGLKLSITTDLDRNLLAFYFTSANGNDRETFLKMNKDLYGIFVADAGYVGKDLAKKFYKENQRILFAKPLKKMRKLITDWQKKLYDTRMLIELNFRNLKMFYNLITSMPRSIDGYFANYVYSILAYVLA
jgi:Transposase DDE domain